MLGTSNQLRSRHTFLLFLLLLNIPLAAETKQSDELPGQTHTLWIKSIPSALAAIPSRTVEPPCLSAYSLVLSPLFFRKVLPCDLRCLLPDVVGSVGVLQLVHVHVEGHFVWGGEVLDEAGGRPLRTLQFICGTTLTGFITVKP